MLVFGFATNETGIRGLLGIVLLLVFLLIIVSVYKNSISIKIHALLLRQASALISYRYTILLYILMYLVCLALFIGLVMFEMVGMWSAGKKIFIPAEYIYYQLQGIHFSGLVTVVIAVQLIWGIAFLKESCKRVII
jgi:hypothetical protein